MSFNGKNKKSKTTRVSNIPSNRNTNKNELNNGGYLDWKTIDELGNSSFVDEYFNTKRQNIVK